MVRHVMSDANVNLHLKPLYEGSTSNVFKSVAIGKVEAGVTLDADVERAPHEVNSQLRTIYTTPPMAPHPLSAHPRISKKLRDTMARAVLKIAKEDRAMLKAVRLAEPVRADYATDYRPLEVVDFKKLTAEE